MYKFNVFIDCRLCLIFDQITMAQKQKYLQYPTIITVVFNVIKRQCQAQILTPISNLLLSSNSTVYHSKAKVVNLSCPVHRQCIL